MTYLGKNVKAENENRYVIITLVMTIFILNKYSCWDLFSITKVSNRLWFYPNILLLPKIINQSNILDGSRMKKDSRKFEKQFENKFISHYQSK